MASNALVSTNFFLPVQEEMRQVEALMRSQAADHHPDLDAALQHLLSSGGKRVRPAIALLTGGMLGGDTARLVRLGAAIELLHTATLVHDDLIDGAYLRRGITTLNAQWSPAATVLTGDFIFARAAVLAAETESVSVIRLFAETLAVIVNGEITQLFTSRGLANREDYERRIYAKTASMFELATAAAAMLSPVSEAMIETMRSFGNAIGMAFQIVDDILDFTGEQATVGKPIGSDLRSGLFTLPALNYLELYPGDPDMQALLNGKYVDQVLLDRLVSAIRLSEAIPQAMQEARRHVSRALHLLEPLPANANRSALQDLAGYIVERNF